MGTWIFKTKIQRCTMSVSKNVYLRLKWYAKEKEWVKPAVLANRILNAWLTEHGCPISAAKGLDNMSSTPCPQEIEDMEKEEEGKNEQPGNGH